MARSAPSSITSSISQSGTVPNKDRRTSDQNTIEKVRTQGHKADAAMLAEVEQVRQDFATQAIKRTETLWPVLRQVWRCSFRLSGTIDYARTAYELLGRWLNEPTT